MQGGECSGRTVLCSFSNKPLCPQGGAWLLQWVGSTPLHYAAVAEWEPGPTAGLAAESARQN